MQSQAFQNVRIRVMINVAADCQKYLSYNLINYNIFRKIVQYGDNKNEKKKYFA